MSITVTQLVGYIKKRFDLDPNLQGLLVTGEISNFHCQINSGHLYFTLKDEHAQIACVMFKSSAVSLEFAPKNGDKVILNARAGVFEQSGVMQLYVSKMKPQGTGDLFQRYEELKRKLNSEGLFDASRKKKLKTLYLEKVCVLVGDKSAAMSDIRTCFSRRWPLAEVTYFPVLVQGNDAPKDIIRNLLDADSKNYDAIIIARGGGSFEDLFCFNDENLVRTIASLNTFTVSGVGHEQDFTLCDFVCDLRAPTPTASVELITPDISEVRKNVKKLCSSECFIHPESILHDKQMMVDYYAYRLKNYSRVIEKTRSDIAHYLNQMSISLKKRTSEKRIVIENLKNAICSLESERIHETENEIESMRLTVKHHAEMKYNMDRQKFDGLVLLLKASDREHILKKGYVLVKENNHYRMNMKDIEKDKIELEFIDGSLTAVTGEKIWKK